MNDLGFSTCFGFTLNLFSFCSTRFFISHIAIFLLPYSRSPLIFQVSTDATVNVVLDPLLLVKKYERDIRELKQELAMHDALSQRGAVNYDPYTAEQQYEMQQVRVRVRVCGWLCQ
jgi:hypothetical protein